MEEIEVPTEALQEEMQHHAAAARESWISRVALSSAFLAVFAAIAALLSGHHVNEAMIEQIRSSDLWAHFQAKSIKASVLLSKHELLASLGKVPVDIAKVEEYKKEQAELSEQAKEKEHAAELHLTRHVILARAVTLFQVAIAIAAISVLARRKAFWYVSLGFGVIGMGFLIQGLL